MGQDSLRIWFVSLCDKFLCAQLDEECKTDGKIHTTKNIFNFYGSQDDK